ncbi:PH domain-containing protein [archaeon]|mgnify:FL=1|jgi:uncharacterized membrane protein YdbT with pleckstrin-like domain|nr:PH domain-containing protein [archaeon]MBT7392182.1 PH domain-containing protein [archaeon]
MNNPYPIQITKRIMFDFFSGLILVLFGVISSWLFFYFVVSSKKNLIGNDLSSLGSGLLFGFSVLGFIAILIVTIKVIWKFIYYKSLNYSLDDKDLIFKGGVISTFDKNIPYSKIQHVIIYETFWQRVLGIKSISIETAREAIPVRKTNIGPLIPDLKKEDAEILKKFLIDTVNKYKTVAGI